MTYKQVTVFAVIVNSVAVVLAMAYGHPALATFSAVFTLLSVALYRHVTSGGSDE